MDSHTRVEPIDPGSADRSTLEDIYQLISASGELDNPGAPALTLETAIGRLKNPQPSLGPVLRWVAHQDSRVVGLAALYFPEAENSHLGLLELTVHPDARRHRIGTAILRAITPELRAHERTVLECWNVTKGGAGVSFATVLGFEVVSATVFQTLSISNVDRSAWEVEPRPGYRLHTWQGTAPGELVASYAEARRAIADSPFGRSAFRFPAWTVERVRESEADRRHREIDHRVVAVVRQDSEQVVGFTELQMYPHREDLGYQGDTAVLAQHRGHSLSFCAKATMLQWLLAERPKLKQVITSTAAANPYMVNVNLALGYRNTREMVILSCGTDKILDLQ
jgi:mycothiol synthase